MQGIVLQAVRDRLRSLYSWTKQQCAIRERGFPSPTSGQFFIGIYGTAMSGTGGENDYFLRQNHTLDVAIWRQTSVNPKDQSGDIYEITDSRRPAIETLDRLESKVTQALHQNQELRAACDAIAVTDQDTFGRESFKTPLVYLGWNGHEPFSLPGGGPDGRTFVGRRIRFRGLTRVQRISYMR